MNRKKFITTIGGIAAMSTLSGFKKFTDDLPEQENEMPVLFIGHGSPMNAIEHNEFVDGWQEITKKIPTPSTVLIVSAHWLTKGTHITAMPKPKTIHDFGGFPKELYEVDYPAPGNPDLAKQTAALISSTNVGLDHDWGLDHGAWSVVRRMYPNADVPMLQLSIDYNKGAQYHYDLAKQLQPLRKKGVLILASGNMIHNLRMIQVPNGDFSKINQKYGFDWAIEMNELLKTKINNGDHQALINYEKLSASAKLAIPTPDHYYPLMYSLALQNTKEQPVIFNDKVIGGSLNMTSVMFK